MNVSALAALLICAGCSLGLTHDGPTLVAVDDKQLSPLWSAAKTFDRSRYGFTPLPKAGQVGLEINSEPSGYDAMLHIGDDNYDALHRAEPYRTIAFRKKGAGFVWIGEQQSFRGPREFDTPDGRFHEQIVLNYEIEYVSGYPLNKLDVTYRGPDKTLEQHYPSLTLEQVRPILSKWGY